MSSINEDRKRLKLILTKDLTQKIQFNPEYDIEIKEFFNAPIDKRIVLLHSVRDAGNEEPEFITEYIKNEEVKGNRIYIPKKFNFQQDETGGIAICNTMRYVIQNSAKATIGYNPDSEGTKFDYGIVIHKQLPTIVLNPKLEITDSIYNWMNDVRDEEKELGKFIYEKVWKNIQTNSKIPIELQYSKRPDKDGKVQPPALSPFSAIELGMTYASQKPFQILNLDEVKAQSNLEDKLGYFKSYSKVALKLHEIYIKLE
jgi:hypothetical protein